MLGDDHELIREIMDTLREERQSLPGEEIQMTREEFKNMLHLGSTEPGKTFPKRRHHAAVSKAQMGDATQEGSTGQPSPEEQKRV